MPEMDSVVISEGPCYFVVLEVGGEREEDRRRAVGVVEQVWMPGLPWALYEKLCLKLGSEEPLPSGFSIEECQIETDTGMRRLEMERLWLVDYSRLHK